ncbi:type VI secretion system Vgr family protein [Achromobacter sp. NPDC058515]|uniref:type VI secretion system Vgr family protein n=1 Tax=Achromobacter sp. NPDC058515 TaxID=3346533 RepID=UPI00366515B4
MPVQSDLRFTFDLLGGPNPDTLEVVEFTLEEGLSETFLLSVDLASANLSIDFGLVLDCPARLVIWHGEQPVRYCHGIVTSFVQTDTGFRRTRYRAVLEPRLARLKLSSDWRIYQTLTVPQIAHAVLKEHGLAPDYEQRATTDHLVREYCVQAGDSDYDFVERILREEGFFYAFHHTAEGHRLIHGDRLYIHGQLDGEPVLYNPMPGGDQPQPALRSFAYAENVRTARQSLRDYTFKNPRYTHERTLDGAGLERQGAQYERYDYPARAKRDEAGEPFAESRLRGHRRDARTARVQGDDPRLQPGIAFKLVGHPREDMNRGWRPVRLVHSGVQHTSLAEDSADAQQGTHYRYTADLVPDEAEWRADPLPRPRIDGPQTAVVVGPPGEEIYTDEYARVKVQFAWDRQGKYDEHSSCWIRVAQNWAGATWGHMAIPRVGQEVIVGNYDGDPDQPVIIGRTYNALQRPPYELPRHKTRMTIKSDTHKGQGYNELRFEDEAGQEEIYVHAQKDQNIKVNHDETRSVGNDQTIGVGRDRTKNIGQDESNSTGRDRKEHIRQDVFSTIDRNEIRKIGNSQREEIASSRQVRIGENDTLVIEGVQSIEAKTSQRTLTRDYVLQGTDRVLIRGPGGKVLIDAGGITLDAVNILLKGNVKVMAPGANQVRAIESAIREGSPLVEECPLDKGG